MNKKYGNLYVQDTIPRTTYSGMAADNRNATVWNILVANENLSDQMAYNIVKAVFEHRDDLIAVHKEAENFKLELQKQAATPIPFHPGAIKYFNEKNIKLQ
jgi:TRAP transporter TAXI family solute receptor